MGRMSDQSRAERTMLSCPSSKWAPDVTPINTSFCNPSSARTYHGALLNETFGFHQLGSGLRLASDPT